MSIGIENITYLSHIISEKTPAYAGRTAFERTNKKSIACSDSCNEQSWTFCSNHIGTHIDFPFHFFADGASGSEISARELFFENVAFLDLPAEPDALIDLTKCNLPTDVELLLVKTGFEKFRGEETFWNNNPGITAASGVFLRENFPRLRAIGFDFISLTGFQNRAEGKKAHQEFLNPATKGRPIFIIEDMHLQNCRSAPKQVVVSPVRVENADGGPVTVIGFW